MSEQPVRIGDFEYFTVEQLSKFLDVTERTIIKWFKENILPGVKIGNKWYMKTEALEYMGSKKLSEKEIDNLLKKYSLKNYKGTFTISICNMNVILCGDIRVILNNKDNVCILYHKEDKE